MGCGSSSTVVPIDDNHPIIKKYKNIENNLRKELNEYKNKETELKNQINNLKDLNRPTEVEDEKQQIETENEITNKKLIKFNLKSKEMQDRDQKLIEKLQVGCLFEDKNFHDSNNNNENIIWLRPFEIVSNHKAGIESISPYEIKQGSLG